MKKNLLYLFLLFFISLFSALYFFHSEPVRFYTVTVNGRFSISVPEYLIKPITNIDSFAILQYQNEQKQFFLLVYEDHAFANHTLKENFKKFSDDFILRIGHAALLKYFPKKINSRDAFIGNIRGTVNETKVYYRIAVIEGDNVFYKIIIGVADDNKSQYDEDMDKIIRGFEAPSTRDQQTL